MKLFIVLECRILVANCSNKFEAKAKCKNSGGYNKLSFMSNNGDMYQTNNQSKFVTNLVSQRNSTFFPHLKPDVKMTEEDERDAELAIHFNKGAPSRLGNGSSSVDTNTVNSDWNIINGRSSFMACFIWVRTFKGNICNYV